MSASAYTVMDPVNKYRHGVLIGNFVEDKFGNDLNERVLLALQRDHSQMHPKSLPQEPCILQKTHFTNLISTLQVSKMTTHNSIRLPNRCQDSLYFLFY